MAEVKDTKRAAFSFEGYQVTRFTFDEPIDSNNNDSFTITFDPSGTYDSKTGKYKIKFNFRAFVPGGIEQDVVTAQIFADFKFEPNTTLEAIPEYFYKNSLAIVFPYLRAFISTLTFQANSKPLILPVLNLSDLEEPLKKNTTLV